MRSDVRITFGMIVLNAEPFLRYNLRSLYPFAHEIIVVEGACRAAESLASPEGHSQDLTLETLRNFKRQEDPDNKIQVIIAEDRGRPDGFWDEKTQMSKCYAQVATGNYLWQIDSDEFYMPLTMHRIVEWLYDDPDISAVEVPMRTFWGGLKFIVNSFYLSNVLKVRRIFKWGVGYKYAQHRPVTVLDDKGRDLSTLKLLTAHQLASKNMYMYHYSMLFPSHVRAKCSYHAKRANYMKNAENWAETCYFQLGNPFKVHNCYHSISWLQKFNDPHPPLITMMIEDINNGALPKMEIRENSDVERLMRDPRYIYQTYILRKLIPIARQISRLKACLRKIIFATPIGPIVQRTRRIFKIAN